MARHSFSAGDEVIIFGKADVGSAKIKALLDMADGALLLDAPLANLRYWNEGELALADNPERVAGPYWLMETSKEFTVCGRHGKIIARYWLTQEAQADAHRARLQTHYRAPAPKKVRITKGQRLVLSRASGGFDLLMNTLGGEIRACVEKGWIEATPIQAGYRITLSAAGLEVLS